MDLLHTPAGLFTSKNVFNVNSCRSLLPEGWSIRRTPADMTNLKLLSAIRSRNCSKSTQLNLHCISPFLNSGLLNADRPWKIGSLNGSGGANGPRRVVLDKSGQKQLSRREHAVLSTLIASVVASTAARHMVAGAAGGCRALAVDSTNPTGECLRLQMWDVVDESNLWRNQLRCDLRGNCFTGRLPVTITTVDVIHRREIVDELHTHSIHKCKY